jgi:hypothetical protein
VSQILNPEGISAAPFTHHFVNEDEEPVLGPVRRADGEQALPLALAACPVVGLDMTPDAEG